VTDETALGEPSLANELDETGEQQLYRAMRRFWHAVAYGTDVTDRPVRATLLDEQLVLVRLAGAVRCFRDLCVHRGTALSLGSIEEDELRCAYHGWTYGWDGVCTKIPSRFGANIPSRARLFGYLCEERPSKRSMPLTTPSQASATTSSATARDDTYIRAIRSIAAVCCSTSIMNASSSPARSRSTIARSSLEATTPGALTP